jgi:branched-chain amino acid transport system substrate-binding protein
MYRVVLFALSFGQVLAALPVQNTVTTSTLNSGLYFDRVLTIGAAISRDNGDKYATLGGMLWGSWELLTEWINIEKGGIVVGAEKWGVQIIEIEDYSNSTMASYAATQLVGSTSTFNVDFMFGPYSSGLTGPVLDITEADSMLMLASGSNQPTVWDGNVQYGYGLLYPGGGYFLDSLTLYAAKGATTAGLICNSAQNANSCNHRGDGISIIVAHR